MEEPVRKAKIMFVEDEPSVIELISILLKKRGFDVVHVGDGGKVLEAVRETRPDLVILDVMLPNLSGFEICHLLKSDPDFEQIPILILSALVQKGEIETGIRMGADLYMTKPFQNSALVANINKLLEERKAK